MLTRRERLRSAAEAEIKERARLLLVSGGPPAISLRAIAREMGMTAPAIYRYFPSLDALVAELTEDLYLELTAAVEADRRPADEPIDQLLAMARAFRVWSVAHPAEFGLLFGNPVPGVVMFEAGCDSPEHAGAKFGAPFLDAFALLSPDLGPAGPGLTKAQLAPFTVSSGVELPVPVVQVFLAAWARLYGLVALEVFGHMRWAMEDTSALFEVELAAFAGQLR